MGSLRAGEIVAAIDLNDGQGTLAQLPHVLT